MVSHPDLSQKALICVVLTMHAFESWTTQTSGEGFVPKIKITAFKFSGLNLELFLEQHEYIGALTETAGYNVAVHHQDSMAYPEDHSVLVEPGSKTHISLTRVMTVMLFFFVFFSEI